MPHKLKKALGLLDLFGISSGAMVSSGLFILPGLAYAKAGPSMILAYLLASFLIIPVMLSKAELATAMPKAGGNYFFIDRSMGPLMGLLGGFADWFSLSLKSAFALLGIGIILLLFSPDITDTQIKLIALACCLFFTFINTIGVKLTGRFQIGMVAVLLSLLAFYVIIGSFFIEPQRYTPFMPFGFNSVCVTTGFVLISYAGLTKIAGVAGEVKNPARNIPLALFLSWGIISLFYVLVLFITVGLLDPSQLHNSLIPIPLGAHTFMGWGGSILLGIAALLAFGTSANAGLLTASRTPMAMSKDELAPRFLQKISKRGTPVASIIFTSSFMILVILFLSLENLVKAASTMIILLFLFMNLAIIIMRESKIRYYRPTFHSPLYPWIQLIGIIAYGFLIFKMGLGSLILVSIFIVCGVGWYFIYAYRKIKREYALLHIVEKLIGTNGTKPLNYLVDEELREILIERDNVTEKQFINLIKKASVIDCEDPIMKTDFSKQIASLLSKRINLKEGKILRLLSKQKKIPRVMIKQGVIVYPIVILGDYETNIILVRCKKGITFPGHHHPAKAVFIITSPSVDHFYIHILMWITNIIEERDFNKKWAKAKDEKRLRKVMLSLWRKRGIKM